MENIKLSFIVPVYNVAPYLRMCVASLLSQDIPRENYEIILVDDGSTDSCPEICDEYARMFANIHVIHQRNGGLSAARNSGIKAARGTYICFVDSDDYWQPNVLSDLMEQIKRENLDVLRFNYQNVRENGEVFVPFKTGKPYFDYRDDVLNGEAFLNERLGYACYAVMFIIKRSLLVKDEGVNGLMDECLFTPGIYFEDTDWTPRMLLRAKRVSSTEKIVYNYLWREGSITLPDNSVKRKKVLDDKMRLISGFIERQELVKDKRWFIWQTAGTAMSILEILTSYSSKERAAYINKLKELKIFPLSTYRAVGNNKYKIRFANISLNLYCRVMSLLRKR